MIESIILSQRSHIIPKNLHNISINEVILKTREMILEDAAQYAEKHNIQNYIILIQSERLIDAHDQEGKYFDIDVCIKSFWNSTKICYNNNNG